MVYIVALCIYMIQHQIRTRDIQEVTGLVIRQTTQVVDAIAQATGLCCKLNREIYRQFHVNHHVHFSLLP